MAREMKDSGIAWIGEIPREWNRVRLGFLYAFSSGSTLTAQDFVDDGLYAVYGANGQRGFYDSFNCQGKHILIGRVGALCGNIHFVDESIWVTEHALISTKLSANIQDEYGAYLLLSMDLGQYASGTAQPVIAAEKIRRLYVPLPPYSEQRRIAAFLDAECARIDAVIEKTRASIEEYKKLKQSVITQAVTKGIRPNRKMKDSGIEWIGEIPEEWSIQRIKNIAQINGRIGFRGYTTEDLVAEGEGPITLSPSNIKEMRLVYEKCSYITWDKYEESPEIQVENGDVLFVKTGSSHGKSGYVANLPMEATINPQLVVFKRIKLDSRYFLYYLQTPSIHNEIEGVVSGGTIPTMAQEKIKNFHVCAPHDYEQKEIADYLDSYTKRIDNMVQRKEKILSELESYKKSLIFEYVTGKKEVV